MLLLLMRGECFCQVFLVQEHSDYHFFFSFLALVFVGSSLGWQLQTWCLVTLFGCERSLNSPRGSTRRRAKTHIIMRRSIFIIIIHSLIFFFSIPLGLPTLTGVGWLVEQPGEAENAWVWNATTGFWVELLLFFALGSSFRWRIWW